MTAPSGGALTDSDPAVLRQAGPGRSGPAGAAGPAVQAAGGAVSAGPTEADWDAAVAAVRQLPADGRVLLICHVNPDGDALGSMLGFALGLRRLGVRRMQATFPGPLEVPEPLSGLPGLELLVPESAVETEPDLVICFDAASESRLGDLADRLAGKGTALVLDHHASNSGFGDVNLVDPDAAATSVVAEELLARLGVPLDAGIAECLYVALSTDTGSFRFDATTPAVHEMAARLLATGIRPGRSPGRCSTAGRSARCGSSVRCSGGPGWSLRRPADRAWCGPTRPWTTWPGTSSGRTCWRHSSIRCAAPPRPT
ncbi:hypothetical protein GCM10029963_29620 [Micromonospora andamanensis]